MISMITDQIFPSPLGIVLPHHEWLAERVHSPNGLILDYVSTRPLRRSSVITGPAPPVVSKVIGHRPGCRYPQAADHRSLEGGR